MPRLTHIQPRPNLRLWLLYDDGVEGEVNLSDLAGQGVFAAWEQPGAFEQVSIGSGGEAVWECGVDLCPDMLYLRLTGKKIEALFPNLAEATINA